jgi:8-oxo-dGTP pyrophosphatase MutT (NUDIX family)
MAAFTGNRFGDLILKSQDVPLDMDEFLDVLETLVKRGERDNAPCVWVNLEDRHIEQTHAVLTAGFETFQVVCANRHKYVRYRKILNGTLTDMSFTQATHYVNISVVVMNQHGEFVCVRDAFAGQKADAPKLITGGVRHSEQLEEAAVREVYEEVGLRVVSQGILGFWQNTHAPNGLGSLLFGVLAFVPPGMSTQLRPDRTEIKNAAWISLDAAFALFEDRPEEAWLRTVRCMVPVPSHKAAFKRWTGYVTDYHYPEDAAVEGGPEIVHTVRENLTNLYYYCNDGQPPSSSPNGMPSESSKVTAGGGNVKDRMYSEGSNSSSRIPNPFETSSPPAPPGLTTNSSLPVSGGKVSSSSSSSSSVSVVSSSSSSASPSLLAAVSEESSLMNEES